MDELVARLVAQERRWRESGAVPAEPRLAATVLLLRADPGGPAVYLVRRAAGMAFAGGMYAFPGGAVDPGDRDGQPLDAGWPARLGRDRAGAWAVVRAAVREVAEETGVRLAPDRLAAWSRWITPEFEPRRYDTFFFLAALPAGQEPAVISGEADRGTWLRPAEAVARAATGELGMLPPTEVTLRELAGYRSVAAALTAAVGRDAATPVLTRLVRARDGTPTLVNAPPPSSIRSAG